MRTQRDLAPNANETIVSEDPKAMGRAASGPLFPDQLASIAGTPAPAAARTIALFELFAWQKRDLSGADIGRMLDLPQSSCSQLLSTLESLGYLVRTPKSRRYYPTARMLEVGQRIAERDPMEVFGAEAVTLLGRLSGESCTFGIIQDAKVHVIAVFEGVHPLRYIVSPGHRLLLHATALGKALLGTLPQEDVARLIRLRRLRRMTDKTVIDVRVLEDEIYRHRELGWYRADGEASFDVGSLAISGMIGNQGAGLAMSGPAQRLNKNLPRYLDMLKEVRAAVFT